MRTAGAQVDAGAAAAPRRASAAPRTRAADATRCSPTTCPEALAGRPFFRNRTDRLLELGGAGGRRACRGGLVALGRRLAQRAAPGHVHRARGDARGHHVRRQGAPGSGIGTALSLLALRNEKVHEGRDTGLTTVARGALAAVGPEPPALARGRPRRSAGPGRALARVSYLDGGFRLDGARRPRRERVRGLPRRAPRLLLRVPQRPPAPRRPTARRADRAARAGLRPPVARGRRLPPERRATRRSRGPATRCWRSSGRASSSARSASPASRCPTATRTAARCSDGLALFAQDEIRRGRWTVSARRAPRPPVRTQPAPRRSRRTRSSPSSCRRSSYAGGDGRFTWTDVLPRAERRLRRWIGARRSLRASYAAYGAVARRGRRRVRQPDRTRGRPRVTFYWLDRNGDHAVQRGRARPRERPAGRVRARPARSRVRRQPARDRPRPTASPRTHELSGSARVGRRRSASTRRSRPRGGATSACASRRCRTSRPPTTSSAAPSRARCSATPTASASSRRPRSRRSCRATAACSRTATAIARSRARSS